MRQQSDRDLIELIGSEDVAALGALYDRHATLLAFRLRRSGASVEEAEGCDSGDIHRCLEVGVVVSR